MPHVRGLYGKRPADPSWGFAYPLIYDNLRRYYGDHAPAVVGLYDGVKAYVEWELRAAAAMNVHNRQANQSAPLLTFHYYGDWLEPGRVPSQESVSQMSAAFNFVQSLRIVRDAAIALGKVEDADRFGQLFDSRAQAFHQYFFDPATNTYGAKGSEVQPSLVYPLWLGNAINNATLEAELFDALVHDIVDVKGLHVATGIVATKWLMELLSRHGASHLGLDLVLQTTFPSWGYMIEQNATTVWEHWEYMNGPGMNSHNHPAFASVGSWLYRFLGGLRLGGDGGGDGDGDGGGDSHSYAGRGACGAPEGAFEGGAFARVIFGPHVVNDTRLGHVSTSMTTIRGPVQSSWRAVYGASPTDVVGLELNLTLPSNTVGEVRIPSWKPAATITVKEGATTVFTKGSFVQAHVSGVSGGCVGTEPFGDEVVVIEVEGGGTYSFTATSTV